MSRAMHLQAVKNKAARKSRIERRHQKMFKHTQALARAGQIAAMNRLGDIRPGNVFWVNAQ